MCCTFSKSLLLAKLSLEKMSFSSTRILLRIPNGIGEVIHIELNKSNHLYEMDFLFLSQGFSVNSGPCAVENRSGTLSISVLMFSSQKFIMKFVVDFEVKRNTPFFSLTLFVPMLILTSLAPIGLILPGKSPNI